MATHTLSILTPSVNNLSARVFVRAAGLDFEEVDVWGKKDEPAFLAKDPAQLTPMLEEDGLPRGSLWESCAIMQYLCNKHGLDRFYPTDPGERAMIDSAMFYLIGHALSARRARHLSRRSASRSTRARSRTSDARRRHEGEGAEGRRGGVGRAARGLPRLLPRRPGLHRRRLSPRSPTSAWPRRSSSCARSTTTSRTGRRTTWRRWRRPSATPTREPAADVRGFVASVTAPAA